MRRLMSFTLSGVLACTTAAAGEKLLQKMLRVAGLTAHPAQMRGPGEDLAPGDIWVVTPGAAAAPLTTGGGYRSPVFAPDGSLLALQGSMIVRIPAAGGAGVTLQKIPKALKLVGFDAANSAAVIVLLDGGDGPPLVMVSLVDGRVTALPYEAQDAEQRGMLAQIRGQQRVYGDTTLYVKTQGRQGMARTLEWTDVYLQRGAAAPRNVSVCDGVDCGQPAQAPDGRKIAFVKVGG